MRALNHHPSDENLHDAACGSACRANGILQVRDVTERILFHKRHRGWNSLEPVEEAMPELVKQRRDQSHGEEPSEEL
jgi:hypothetical protein